MKELCFTWSKEKIHLISEDILIFLLNLNKNKCIYIYIYIYIYMRKPLVREINY